MKLRQAIPLAIAVLALSVLVGCAGKPQPAIVGTWVLYDSVEQTATSVPVTCVAEFRPNGTFLLHEHIGAKVLDRTGKWELQHDRKTYSVVRNGGGGSAIEIRDGRLVQIGTRIVYHRASLIERFRLWSHI